MKKTFLVIWIFLCQLTLTLRAQNIQQTAPVVLPQSPSTSYVVGSGENRIITSAASITLLPGTHFVQGSQVLLKIQSQPVPPAPSNPNSNSTMNWIASKTYDLDGNVIAENKNFFDDAGTTIQNQTKNISKGHVLAREALIDVQDRQVGKTLVAPINNSAFSYKSNFVTINGANHYSYQHFDLLKTNQPDPVGNVSEGTLGWYYSDNNSLETHVASTAYPYSRTTFNEDGSNTVKAAAGVGDEMRMGRGREYFSNQVAVTNELDFYTSIRDHFFPSSIVGERQLLSGKALMNVLTDANQNSTIKVTDLSGNPLMMARPDINGLLTLQHQTILNAVKKEYLAGVTLASMIMGGENPNQGGIGGGPLSFAINSKYNVKVYHNNIEIYNGIGNDFEFSGPISFGASFEIKSDYPFSISHSDGCDSCPAKIAESNASSIRYFNLLQSTAVNITGNYELFNMATETAVTVGTLPAGYYKLVALQGDVTLSYSTKVSDISYVFYNQLGQNLASIAPEGVNALITNGINSYASLNDVPFVNSNTYDLQGRLIAAKNVDAGLTEFIYRKDGAIRFTQNVEQRKTGRFSYVNYDRWGRTVEAGEYLPGDISFVAAKTNSVLLESVAEDGGLATGTKQYVTRNHYDLPNQSHGLNNYIQDEAFVKGNISWTENSNSKTWYNYDEQGRVVWTIKNIVGLGVKTVDYTYNSGGIIEKVDYQKSNANERFIHYYEYNSDLALSSVYTSKDDIVKKKQASYDYYVHGPLKRMEIGNDLQGIDYVYASNGMLKAINHPQQSFDPGKDGIANNFAPDVFGMTLEYFNGDYYRSNTGITSIATNTSKSWYNGNISGQVWRSKKPDAVTAVAGSGINGAVMSTYEYDDRKQFNNNKFGTPDFLNNTFSETLNVNKEHGLIYDANGNIKALSRNNAQGTQQNLNYNYQPNTNKLNSVDNYATYSYNDLGQMIVQERQSGQKFYLQYEPSGKVSAIYADADLTQLKVSFAYDENGLRLRKTDHLQNVTTYYVYDANGAVMSIYDNNGTPLQQKEVPFYSTSRLGTFFRINDKYQYELKDHLGNVRAVIGEDKNVDGSANVLYYSDYYPFGSRMSLANSNYRFGYQGQYAEVDPETGWNNFDLRMYDPAIGRWMSVDPYNEFWSSYVGMGNNPISTTDPDGGCTKCPPPGENAYVYDKKTNTFSGSLLEVTIVRDSYAMGPYTYAFSGYNHAEAGAGLARAGFNLDKQYYGANGNLNIIYAKAYAKEGQGTFDYGASTGVIHADLEGRLGREEANVKMSNKVDLLAADINIEGALYNSDGQYKAGIGGHAGAYVAKAESKIVITIFGARIEYEYGGSAASAHIGGKSFFEANRKTGAATLEMEFDIGLGLGVKQGIKIQALPWK
ncbi:RHS repeat domain-containing protein [Pedobacter chitinilyticus]|uniref:RHS repeat-associated core domain-containing protein n=1 Tax=Pedobacter chitinilyticus TaxID=2233776 RepID=A0A443Z0C5_9SPHI|nr:RHS repeat-associated core domain-containing protein [Pedobacter chitinilyticus]RWU09945.1 RHS repeat-associated core domain-containing protein [Pedobacter chitinilyticus]